MGKDYVKILIFIECQKVGLEQNYFGKIKIQNKIFDYNFSIIDLDKKINPQYLELAQSVDLVLFNNNGLRINLDKEEFSFFVSILIVSLDMASNKFSFDLNFSIEISSEKAQSLLKLG